MHVHKLESSVSASLMPLIRSCAFCLPCQVGLCRHGWRQCTREKYVSTRCFIRDGELGGQPLSLCVRTDGFFASCSSRVAEKIQIWNSVSYSLPVPILIGP